MSQDGATYEGQCYCGAVAIEVTGDPLGAGYCHCKACRSWSAGPVNAFTLWKSPSVVVTKGADQLASFNKTSNSFRKWCKACGGHVMTVHPVMFRAKPGLHQLQGFFKQVHGRFELAVRQVEFTP